MVVLMRGNKPSQLHPEEAKLVSAIAVFFGALLVFMAVLMLSTAGYENARDAAPALMLLWAGLVIVAAGRNIKRTLVLFYKPRLFLISTCVRAIVWVIAPYRPRAGTPR